MCLGVSAVNPFNHLSSFTRPPPLKKKKKKKFKNLEENSLARSHISNRKRLYTERQKFRNIIDIRKELFIRSVMKLRYFA